MNGDNSGQPDERWCLLRSLYESHRVGLDEIALISGIEIGHLIQRSCDELWQIEPKLKNARKKAVTASPHAPADLRQANAKTANQVSVFLKRMLKMQTQITPENETKIDPQTGTKNVLAIAKGVLTIEEMIANMEKLTDAASLYPQDTLEFHSKLEKQIANLAGTKPAKAIS